METTPFNIVPAGLSDLGELRQIEKECFSQDAWPLLDLLGVLTFPGVARFKAVAEGHMVGFAAGDPHSGEGVGWITTIGVRVAFRRRGIATALLHTCEAAMRQPRVRLCVRKSNQAARSLYAREGYREVDIWPGYYAGGEDAVVLEKHIPNVG